MVPIPYTIMIINPYTIMDRLHLISWVNLTIITLSTLDYHNILEIKEYQKYAMDFILIGIISILFITFLTQQITGLSVVASFRKCCSKVDKNTLVHALAPVSRCVRPPGRGRTR